MASERKQWPGGIISENGLEKHPQEKKKKKKKTDTWQSTRQFSLNQSDVL